MLKQISLRFSLVATAVSTAALFSACHEHQAVFAAGSGGGTSGSGVDQALVDEFRGVLSGTDVGPIPAPPAVSGELVELGRALFHDVELSGDRDVSCATCHLAEFGGADGRTLPRGVGGQGLGPDRMGGPIIPRNSPGLFNLHLQDVAFWDGRVELLPGGVLVTPAGAELTPAMEAAFPVGLEVIAAQAMFPPTSRDEMRSQAGSNEIGDIADGEFQAIWSALMDRVLSFPSYVDAFAAAYPGVPAGDLTFAHAAGAIAAFEVTEFYRPDSPFQSFLAGDDLALTNQQLRGGIEFFGVAACASCHRGPLLSDMRFHNVGMPQLGPGKGDGPGMDDDFGRERVSGDAAERYAFRTPTLIGIAETAPYGHAGEFRTLRRTVAHYRDPSVSIYRFFIEEEVLDPELFGTQIPNELEVLQTLSPLASSPLNFSVNDVTAFLTGL